MTVRVIETASEQNSNLPPLRLRPHCLSSTDEQYDYNPDIHKPAIEPIEHKIRLDIMRAGYFEDDFKLLPNTKGSSPWLDHFGDRHPEPLAYRHMEQSLISQMESEERFYNAMTPDQDILDEAPEYLATQIRNAHKSTDDTDEQLRKVQKDREKWYQFLIPRNFNTAFQVKTLGGLISGGYDIEQCRPRYENIHGNVKNKITYIGVIVIEPGRDKQKIAEQYNVEKQYVRYGAPDDFSGSATEAFPADYGIEYPAPVLMAEYPSGSEYLLIPWSGGLVCQGPYKQNAPHRVVCKHEVAAALVLSEVDSIFLPLHKGVDIPARSRRFIDPRIAATHNSETPNTP